MQLSPKSQQLYQLLLESEQPLDAKQLADKMDIFPTTVYRLAEPLIEMGLISKNNKYPHEFLAKQANEGLSLFLLYQNEWFAEQFKVNGHATTKDHKIPQSEQIELSFVQSRDELMRLSAKELERTKQTVDLLRSGHEIPADTMLAMFEAQKRGVQIRMLIQDFAADNVEQVANWQKNGILVRKTSLRHVRLMLYDASILYFMSYKNTESERDLGMKINYPPFAAMLAQLFEKWWEKAEII